MKFSFLSTRFSSQLVRWALLTGVLLGSALAQKLGTFEYTPGAYFKYFSSTPALNVFQCGAGKWAVLDPTALYARGQVRTEGLILSIEMDPATWQLEGNYRGRELPIVSVEVITDDANGAAPRRYVYKPKQVNYDARAHVLQLTLPPVASQARFLLGKVNLADRSCKGSMLFTVRSTGG